MVNLKILRQMIKDSIDREQTAHILTGLGFEVGRDWKFALREDERTPSASIRQDGYISDFGDGRSWSDVVALLHENRGLSLKDATLFVCEQMGISTDESYEHVPLPIKRNPQPTIELTNERYRQIVSDIGKFDRSDKQTFSDEGYKQSALSIAPMWLYEQAQETDRQLFREFTTYDEVLQVIVLKIHDYTSKLISYKHRYKMVHGNVSKWCNAYSTHPNKQCMVSIPSSNDTCPIFVVEGARDFLTMVLLGLNVIMIQTVGYQEWTEHELSLLTGRKVILMPDIDSKSKGLNCMKNLAAQIIEPKSIKIFNVKKILDFAGIRHNDPKMDFSDAVNLWTKGRDEFISTLSYLTYERSKNGKNNEI